MLRKDIGLSLWFCKPNMIYSIYSNAKTTSFMAFFVSFYLFMNTRKPAQEGNNGLSVKHGWMDERYIVWILDIPLPLWVRRQDWWLSTLISSFCVSPYATLWRSYCPTGHPTTHTASDSHPHSSLQPLHLSVSLPPTTWSASPLKNLHWRNVCLVCFCAYHI